MTIRKPSDDYTSYETLNRLERIERLTTAMQADEAKSDALWAWLKENVAHPDFIEQTRRANEADSRIAALHKRINNLTNGEPELGASVDYYSLPKVNPKRP